MVRIVIGPDVRRRLDGVFGVAEVYGDDGRLLGHFVPAPEGDRLDPQVSDQELDRREAAGGGRPLAAILADLAKIA